MTCYLPVISYEDTRLLSYLVAEHYKLYLLLSGSLVTPKMHFHDSISKKIELGPPTRYWTLRYEQSHALPKHTLRALNNPINVGKTIVNECSYRYYHLASSCSFI